MNTLSDILNKSYSNQGIQNMEVFFDSYFFNLKIKNNSEYNNIILIEKLEFDYSKETINRIKNHISVNFGNTGFPNSSKSNGNGFLGSYLDKKLKKVLLIGTKVMRSGNIIPVIYSYDINKHSVAPIFPKPTDVTQFNSLFKQGTFIPTFASNTHPIIRFSDSLIFIGFQTEFAGIRFIHKITLKYYSGKIILQNYETYEYDGTDILEIADATTNSLLVKIGNYYTFLDKSVNGEEAEAFCLDDNFNFLTFDDSYNILSLGSKIISSEILALEGFVLDNITNNLAMDDSFSILSVE